MLLFTITYSDWIRYRNLEYFSYHFVSLHKSRRGVGLDRMFVISECFLLRKYYYKIQLPKADMRPKS